MAPSVYTGRQALVLLIAVAVAVKVASAALKVEHSFDGAKFSPAGELIGDPESDVELSWERPPLSDADLAAIDAAAKADQLYLVRVQTNTGALLTSVPAKCLLGPALREQAELHADRNGAIIAFNYAAPSCLPLLTGAADGAAAASGAAAAGAAAERPERLPVRVVLPVPGPLLSMPEVAGEFADVSVDAMGAGSLGGAATYDPNAKPRAAPQQGRKSTGQAGQQPPEETSWLRKNWLFVVAAGMMVVNVLTKANAPQGGAPGAPAAAGGGGGGGGGGARRG